MKCKNILGERYGRLLVVKETDERDKSRHVMWLCKCDCGTEKLVSGYSLRRGDIVSCGCYALEVSIQNLKCSDPRKASLVAAKLQNKDGTNLNLINKRSANKNSSTGIRGVSFDKRRGRWRATLTLAGKYHSLGCYVSPELALEARNRGEQDFYKPILAKYGLSSS